MEGGKRPAEEGGWVTVDMVIGRTPLQLIPRAIGNPARITSSDQPHLVGSARSCWFLLAPVGFCWLLLAPVPLNRRCHSSSMNGGRMTEDGRRVEEDDHRPCNDWERLQRSLRDRCWYQQVRVLVVPTVPTHGSGDAARHRQSLFF